MVGVPNVERFLDGGFNDFRAVLRVANDGVVEHLEFPAADLGLEDFRPLLDLVAEADAAVLAEELEHREQLAVRQANLLSENQRVHMAKRLEDLKAGTEPFSLIRRTKKDKTVYTAFCSKGNTTVVVSLSSGGKNAASVDEFLPKFKELVASFKLTPKVMELDD